VLKGQSRARVWIEQHQRDPEDDLVGNVVYHP
jgi:hypothetical protein